jgi:hypothetical protein
LGRRVYVANQCPHAQRPLPRGLAFIPTSTAGQQLLVPSEPPPPGSGSHSRDLTAGGLDLRAGHLRRRLEVCDILLHQGPCSAPPFSNGRSRRPAPLPTTEPPAPLPATGAVGGVPTVADRCGARGGRVARLRACRSRPSRREAEARTSPSPPTAPARCRRRSSQRR